MLKEVILRSGHNRISSYEVPKTIACFKTDKEDCASLNV